MSYLIIPSIFIILIKIISGIMGSIVFWGIIRTAIFIPVMWILSGYIESPYWWTLLALAIYGVILQPAFIQYRLFLELNNEVLEHSLCSSCNFFDKTAVICLKFDKHPDMNLLPCQGTEWEPVNEYNKKEETDS